MWASWSLPQPERYFDIRSVSVLSKNIDTETIIQLDVDRSINAEFYGKYIVTVLQYNEDKGGYVGFCRGQDDLHYRLDAVLPEPGDGPRDLNLGWWIYKTDDPSCGAAIIDEPGIYYIRTCWRIERPWTFTIPTCINTETFTVKEKEKG